jgi:hypothetical protein
MEKETLNGSTQFACKALLSKMWAYPADASTSFTVLKEVEVYTDMELEQITSRSGASEGIPFGSTIVGLLAGENSYGMELSERVNYYWPFFSRYGLVCLIPQDLKYKVHEGHTFYTAEELLTANIGVEPGQLRVSSTSSPYNLPLSPELYDFCLRNNLLSYLNVAVELVSNSFPEVKNISLEIEHDPDTAEEWLIIAFEITGSIENILAQYDLYTDLWIGSVPSPERDKIRLSYNII